MSHFEIPTCFILLNFHSIPTCFILLNFHSRNANVDHLVSIRFFIVCHLTSGASPSRTNTGMIPSCSICWTRKKRFLKTEERLPCASQDLEINQE